MKTRTSRAVYPGTFDPITRGHEDLVRRASTLFDEMIVAVADSRGKSPFFTVEERVAMAKETLAPFDNVRVEGFSGLLMDFLHKHDAKIILRGLRIQPLPSGRRISHHTRRPGRHAPNLAVPQLRRALRGRSPHRRLTPPAQRLLPRAGRATSVKCSGSVTRSPVPNAMSPAMSSHTAHDPASVR